MEEWEASSIVALPRKRRTWGTALYTLQDRLVLKLHLVGASMYEQANEFPATHLPRLNVPCAVPAALELWQYLDIKSTREKNLMKETANGTSSNERMKSLKVAIVGKRKLDLIGISSILDSVENVLIVEQFQIDELSAFRIPLRQVDVFIWCLLNVTPAHIILFQQLSQKRTSITHALIMTHIHPRILRNLIKLGYNICISHDDVVDGLPLALQHIMKSQCYISSSLLMEPCFPPYILDKGNIILEERELIISKLLAQGYHNRDIAREVGLTVKSVERHLTLLYSKLHVRSRAEAVAFMTQEGILFD